MTTSEAPTDNGVNVQALLDARNALTDAPEAAEFTWRATQRVAARHAQPRRRSAATSASAPTTSHKIAHVSYDADHPEVFASEDRGRRRSSSCSSASRAASPRASRRSRRTAASSSTRSKATVEGDMNILGILGGDPEVRNGFNDIRVNFEIDADATPTRSRRSSPSRRSARRCSTRSPTRPTSRSTVA